MARVENLQKVITLFNKKGDSQRGASVLVGYTAAYSIYVHENLTARHPVGQAKFLEQPAREYSKQIAEIIATAARKGKTMAQSLLLGGLFLQRQSQLLCPVDTGALRASAFTRQEDK